jgi:hypothetical protein
VRRLRWWLGLLAVIVIVAVAKGYASRQHPALDPTRDFSCERTNKWGTKAARELCEWRGLRTEVWRRSLADVSKAEGTVCVIAPEQVLSSGERAALTKWVQAGGHLVVAVKAETPTEEEYGGEERLGGSHHILAWLGMNMEIRKFGAPAKEVAVTGVPPDWSGYKIERLAAEMPSGLVWHGDKAQIAENLRAMGADEKALKALPNPVGATPVGQLEGDGQVLGMAMRLGRGRVDVLSDAEFLSNMRLGKADNALLAAAILLGEGRGAVAFDEYHHGLAPGTESESEGIVSAALMLLMLAMLLAILPGVFMRFGKARTLSGKPRRTIGEYVRATAWLYQGAGMSGAALAMLGHEVRRGWATRLGVRPDAPPEEFGLAARQRGMAVGERLEKTLAGLAAVGPETKVSREELLRLGAELTSLKREWAHRG